MLSGQSLLVFAPSPWDDMWRNRHQIMSRLARSNTVLWVEPRLSLRQTLRGLGRATLHWLPAVRRVSDGLYVMRNPALLPASGPLAGLSDALYRAYVRHTLSRLRMARPILWLYLPEMAAIIGQYNERLVVYHVVDEYTAYAGVTPSYAPIMRANEERLLARASVVITTAPSLLESKSRFNRNVHLVANAVDYEGFQRTLANGALPPEIAALAQPVIGYVGAINDKLDYALLAAVAAARPDWSLAMVGPVSVQTGDDVAGYAALRKLANVHFFGQAAVAGVPRYIAACNVCLLPYKLNERTRSISSLKMYEYLACGKPVVATDVPAAHEVGPVVRIAGAGDFVSAIDEALHDNPAAVAGRRSVAAANTWEQRVEAISDILSKML